MHGVPTLGLRFFNVYGPRQDPNSPYSGVISIFANAIASGNTVTINGDGKQTRDFIFVGDIVRFLTAGMDAPDRFGRTASPICGGVLNACTGGETSVLQMACLIGDLIGCEVEIVHGPTRPGDISALGRLACAGGRGRSASRRADRAFAHGLEATLAGLAAARVFRRPDVFATPKS